MFVFRVNRGARVCQGQEGHLERAFLDLKSVTMLSCTFQCGFVVISDLLINAVLLCDVRQGDRGSSGERGLKGIKGDFGDPGNPGQPVSSIKDAFMAVGFCLI